MSIHSISGSSALDPYQSASATSSAATAGVDADGDHDGSKAAGGPRLSPRAQLLSKLQQLVQSDPIKARQVLTDLANNLRTDAQQAGGSQAGQLNQLADKLQKAADTGDLSGLQPQGGGHKGGHHHHAQSSYAQNAGSGQSLLDMLNSQLSSLSASSSSVASTAIAAPSTVSAAK